MTPLRIALAALIALLAAAPAAFAQPTPTPEQIELFRQLPPAEQQRLMEQLRNGQSGRTEQPLEQPETVQPRTVTQPDLRLRPPPPRTSQGTTQRGDRNGPNGASIDTLDQLYQDEPEPEPEPLKLFGYDLFAGAPTTFAPVTDVPIPVDYVVGPGDMVNVQLFGKTTGTHTLVINRDGSINFPELGPITVAGMTFDAMRNLLQERVAQQMIGVTASISLGELRSIRIFVLGEAERPGSYQVSSLSTITNALFVSGGIKTIGSLRNIQLKREGELVSTMDLYDLLLRGDTRGDARLMPGDVIFIPPVGSQVGIEGEVLRPAIYELKGERTVGDLVQLGGGLAATAYAQQAQLSRISDMRQRIQQDVDLRSPAGQGMALRKGDLLHVPSVLDIVDNVVTLDGHVMRPGRVEYRRDMRLTDLIRSMQDLQPMADINYVLIRREMPPERRLVALSADLEAALRNPGGPADVRLMPRDDVRVFHMIGERPDVEELVTELRAQASLDRAAPVVRVGGRVRAAGNYPLEPGMRVSDLLRAGGALAEGAYAVEAEVTRYDVIGGEYREIGLIPVDLNGVRRGDPTADIVLQPYDFLNVREVTHWREQETVILTGEVRFPGSYPIRKGETLLSVLQRAGGLTDRAYANGAVFTRERLKEREEQQVQQLIERMEADLAALALQQAQSPDDKQAEAALVAGRGMLNQLRATTPVGRLALDLPQLMKATVGSQDDLALQDGDTLMIPGPMQTVTVIGEVHSPTSLLYDRALGRNDYIDLSGGATRRADMSRVYIVRANGQVTAAGDRRWFRSGATYNLMPGDTIVVPADVERMRPLPLWTAVTTIVYNMAVAVAAINSF
ncbi:MAG: SLBB domain-containing protein [Pseudomonadales bacterium]|nr:SLBB domain-containing protein [Pseudomonadales bacterium]